MKLILLAAGLFLATAPVSAQNGEGGVDFFRSSLQEIMDTPILAASYTEEKPSDTAATAYVVTADTIRKRGYGTLADLLDDMPQFQLQRNSDARNLNLLTVRGISGNERLVILYNGVRVSPPTGDLMALAGQFSLKDAERVEIVLGPMSAVYGADAFSGVVNIVTRRYGRSSVSASCGSFDSRSVSASAMSAREERPPGDISAAVTFDARASDNPKLPSLYRSDYAWYNNQYQSGLAQTAPGNPATVSVPVTPYDAASDSSFLYARADLENLELGVIKGGESHSSSTGVKPELTLYDKDARFGTDYWTFYGRHVYTSPAEDWRLTSLFSFYNYEIDPGSRFINSFSGYQDAYKYASAQTASLQETLSFDAAEETPVLLGLSYQYNSDLPYTADLSHEFNTEESPNSQGFVYTGSTIPVDFYSLRYADTGAFVRAQRRLGDAVFSLGLRYDHSTNYGETWNPRAGAVWHPGGSEATTVKLLYGEAYLAPSPFDSEKVFGSFVSSPTAPSGYYSYFFHVPNEDLKPELMRSAEASVAHDFDGDLRVSLNPYYNKVRNLIQDVVTGPGTFHGVEVASVETALNRGTMETYGATLKADASFRSGRWGIEPWAAYTYSDGRLRGDPVPFNSRGTLEGGVSVLRGRWAVTPKAVYRSRCLDQDGTPVPSFTVADLYIKYSVPAAAGNGFSAWLKITNLLDRRYYNAAYGGGADHLAGAPQDPFAMSCGASYSF